MVTVIFWRLYDHDIAIRKKIRIHTAEFKDKLSKLDRSTLKAIIESQEAEYMTKMRDKPRTSSAGKDSAGCASSPGKLMKPPIG